MPVGKGLQRGFVRGVGNTPSPADRKNKRDKVTVEKTKIDEGEVTAKLEGYKIQYPELYKEALRFAHWFDSPKQKTDELTLKYLEDALQASKETKRLDDLLAAYQPRSSANH